MPRPMWEESIAPLLAAADGLFAQGMHKIYLSLFPSFHLLSSSFLCLCSPSISPVPPLSLLSPSSPPSLCLLLPECLPVFNHSYFLISTPPFLTLRSPVREMHNDFIISIFSGINSCPYPGEGLYICNVHVYVISLIYMN